MCTRADVLMHFKQEDEYIFLSFEVRWNKMFRGRSQTKIKIIKRPIFNQLHTIIIIIFFFFNVYQLYGGSVLL